MTRVLVVGGGGREHALAWACRRSGDDVEVICAPGNGGTHTIARNLPVDVTDAAAVARLAAECGAGLVVIGPDAAAAAGVADACGAAGIAVFGPRGAAARIESSKEFAKQVMDDAGIATAAWTSGGAGDMEALLAFARDRDGRCAVKADGLALGKGVVVCTGVDEARRALEASLVERRFGAAGERVVVEELLDGDEVSVFGVTDGVHVRTLPVAQDYKRLQDGDRGPNTGGMGAVAPVAAADDLADAAVRDVLQPCVDRLRELGTPFTGCLYAGLMRTSGGLRVLEFNARFGDPETQVVLPLLSEDLLGVMRDAAAGALVPGRVAAVDGAAVGVVACAAGYPGAVRTGDRVEGADRLDEGVLCFHAGTRMGPDGVPVTTGGRVLIVVGVAKTVEAARMRAYDNVARIRFDGMHFRQDIGTARTAAARSVR